MNRLWSDLAKRLQPYTPGEQATKTDQIKLNTNECPTAPSPRVLEAIRETTTESLRRYPDPESKELKRVLAHYHGLTPQQVFVGNGSDEVLGHAFAALLKQSAPLLMPDITYSFYPAYCKLYDIDSYRIPLSETLEIDVADYAHYQGPVVLANPNAPTGLMLSLSEISTLLRQRPNAPVIIDEAYVDFGGETAISLIADHPNLLIVRTMSKSRALAGLRVGYALGNSELIEALDRVKNSFNSYPLGHLAQAGAIASVSDDEYFIDSCRQIIKSREILADGLSKMGYNVLKSAANFVFACHPELQGPQTTARLKESGILVRNFRQPRIDQYLRISVGLPGETQRLLTELSSLVKTNLGR